MCRIQTGYPLRTLSLHSKIEGLTKIRSCPAETSLGVNCRSFLRSLFEFLSCSPW